MWPQTRLEDLQQARLRRRKIVQFARRAGTALGIDPDRHEARRVDAGSRCKLVPPHRQQPADNAMASGHLGSAGVAVASSAGPVVAGGEPANMRISIGISTRTEPYRHDVSILITAFDAAGQ